MKVEKKFYTAISHGAFDVALTVGIGGTLEAGKTATSVAGRIGNAGRVARVADNFTPLGQFGDDAARLGTNLDALVRLLPCHSFLASRMNLFSGSRRNPYGLFVGVRAKELSKNLRAKLAAQALRARDRFVRTAEEGRARETQHNIWLRCVSPNTETEFGREHGFSKLACWDDYRAAVPIRPYEKLAPWIERAAAGIPGVLTTEDPIRFWKTTGTTAEPKKIPVTPSSSAQTMEAFLVLYGTQLHHYPELAERPDTTLVTHLSPKPIREFLGPKKIPYCSTTEYPTEVRPGQEEVIPPWQAELQSVVEDDAERLYYLLCFAANHDLYALACLHPSRFLTVLSTLETQAERLIQELGSGTLLGRPRRLPEPERALRLQQVLRTQGRLRPKDLWPNLRLLCSWSGSYLVRYRQAMERDFCSGFLPMPSISSEAFLTMTVDPDPIAGPLNLKGGFFEFLPEEGTPEDTDTFTYFELEDGRRYEAILTTLGGLYRYSTSDLFQVSGRWHGLPRLEYLGRRSVSDLTGEKLAEVQVQKALQILASQFQVGFEKALVCAAEAEQPKGKPGYLLLWETAQDSPVEGLAQCLAQHLDDKLRDLNSRYQLKRGFGDLAPLEVRFLRAGCFQEHQRRQMARGAPAGQLKDRVLCPLGDPILSELLDLDRQLQEGAL